MAFLTSALCLFSCASFGYSATKAISIESVFQRLKSNKDIVIVDVRDSAQFKKFRIPGSVNISLFAIKTKTFLMSRPLVLVNEGHSYRQLADESEKLLEAGFIVSILDGGLYGWKQKNGPLEGDVFTQRGLNRISPQTYFTGKHTENRLVINVSRTAVSLPAGPVGKTHKATANNKNSQVQPDTLHIPFINDPKRFVQELKLVIKNHKEKDFFSVLLCDEDGKTYEEIDRHLQAAGIHNVLYLEGGLDAYKTFEQQHVVMTQVKRVATKSTGIGTNEKGCTVAAHE